MYGWETIDLRVPGESTQPVHFGKHRFGKGAKLRSDHHAYISAVGVLQESAPSGPLHLNLYLNRFADRPVPIEAASGQENITIFNIALPIGNELPDWESLPK